MPPRYPSSKLPVWRDVCNNRVWTKVFLNAIYRQKVTPNPHMQLDMKEIKNKINGDRLQQPLATPCAPKRWSPIFVHCLYAKCWFPIFVHCLCAKMSISNLCPLLVHQNVDFQSLSIIGKSCLLGCKHPLPFKPLRFLNFALYNIFNILSIAKC